MRGACASQCEGPHASGPLVSKNFMVGQDVEAKLEAATSSNLRHHRPIF